VMVPGFSAISIFFLWDCFHVCIDTLMLSSLDHTYILTTLGYIILILYLSIVSYTGTRSSVAQGYIYRLGIPRSRLLRVFYLHYLESWPFRTKPTFDYVPGVPMLGLDGELVN